MSYFAMGYWVLGLSVLVSAAGALVGFTCIKESTKSVTARFRTVWLTAASVSIGAIGIWLAIFVSMLGVNGPGGVSFRYDVARLLGAAILAGLAVFAGLIFLGRALLWPRLVGCALAMGAGLSLAMYVGMDALQVRGSVELRWAPVIGSIVLLVALSVAMLWFVLHRWPLPAMIGAAIVVGLTVIGAHYLWLAGLEVHVDSRVSAPDGEELFTFLVPMFVIGMLSLAIPITAVLVAPDRRSAGTAPSAARGGESELIR
ncbi:MHYT domain-containing protein [Nocardia aurea]|uniref:MHYT domain-containing protein n=1 Tax=Nocardia aurea TaxID=2144174 RepID=UPI0013001CAE|nr:MHYT domain-containing protein [Nocardia aurea]